MDQTPPVFEASEPAAGAVNVSAEAVRLTFSEYVEPASFTRALSITPEPEGRPDVSWHGRTAVVRFPEPLRPNTTYVLTLDTNLRDVNGVALRAPLTLAFSTGPTINQGRLAGRVVSPGAGEPAAGLDVLAYAAPDSVPPDPLPERADYRTQTGPSGQFAFRYLAEQPYYVVAVRDANRNRRPDALEAYAVPPRPVLRADSTGQDSTLTWVVTAQDTAGPVPQRVRTYSARRVAVRFSEPVRFVSRDPSGWMLRDTVGGPPPRITGLYQLPEDPFQVFVLTDSLPGRPHLLRPAALADTAGNAVRPATLRFTPSATADTTRLRFRTFVPDTTGAPGRTVLAPEEAPAVRFNQSVDSTRLRTVVAVSDTAGRALPYTAASPDGVTYRLETVPPFPPGQAVTVTVDDARLGGADTLFTRTFERPTADALGELSGTVATGGDTAAVVVELYTGEGPARRFLRQTRADATGRFLFGGLPAGAYRLRLYVDRNDNGRWDGGRVAPYVPAEPLFWSPEAYRVRARWETALPDTLRVGGALR